MVRKIMRDSGALICGENDDSLHFFGEQTHIKIALNMIEEIIKVKKPPLIAMILKCQKVWFTIN